MSMEETKENPITQIILRHDLKTLEEREKVLGFWLQHGTVDENEHAELSEWIKTL